MGGETDSWGAPSPLPALRTLVQVVLCGGVLGPEGLSGIPGPHLLDAGNTPSREDHRQPRISFSVRGSSSGGGNCRCGWLSRLTSCHHTLTCWGPVWGARRRRRRDSHHLGKRRFGGRSSCPGCTASWWGREACPWPGVHTRPAAAGARAGAEPQAPTGRAGSCEGLAQLARPPTVLVFVGSARGLAGDGGVRR